MTKEEGLQKIQVLLAEMASIMNVVADIAAELEIERVDFMGQQMHFGVEYRDSWARGPEPGFISAAGGPRVGEYWSASTMHCWPTDKQRTWLFGPDQTNWPRTGYEEE